MKRCIGCGHECTLRGIIAGTAVCDGCGADIHTCTNCRHHQPGSYRRCSHADADPPRDDDRANNCEFFEMREASDRADGGRLSADEAKKRFDKLFGE